MKKSIKIFIALFVVAIGFSSCLKDKTLIHPDNTVGNVVEFYNLTPITSGTSATFPIFTPLTLDAVATAEFEAAVNYAGADVAPEDITVQIAADPTAIATYNAKHGTKYNAIAANTYTLPTSVVIPKGQRVAKFKVGVKPTMFDASKENYLALKITSASKGVVSGNFGTVLFNLPVKSIWEGVYTVTVQNNYGNLDANIGADPYTEHDVKLSTVGPNRMRANLVALTYSGFTEYQFNGNNTSITEVAATSGTPRATSIQEIIVIDPGKVFELRWTFIDRGLRERYVKQ